MAPGVIAAVCLRKSFRRQVPHLGNYIDVMHIQHSRPVNRRVFFLAVMAAKGHVSFSAGIVHMETPFGQNGQSGPSRVVPHF